MTGTIGSLQSLEVIKILLPNLHPAYAGKLLCFDATEGTFRTIRLRGRQVGCKGCDPEAGVKQLIDYNEWCGMKSDDKCEMVRVLKEEERISCLVYILLSLF